LLVCGSNTTEAHPIVGLKVKDAVKKGTKIIVIDPRRTEIAKIAEESPTGIFLRIKPGSNIPLLNGMLNVIFEEGLENKEFIENRVEGIDAIREHVATYTPDKVSETTGVSEDMIRDAARLYATSEKSLILYGLGVAEHKGGTYGVIALANLVLATGQVGKPHCGINPLRGQNNVQGSCDMGALPYSYPGYQHPDDPEAMEVFSKIWEKDALPVEDGLMEPQMYEKALKGEFKALYLVGYDPAHTQANISSVQKALKSLEFLAVQDMFMTETAKLAHVVFPSSCAFEKDGTVTSGERRVRRLNKAVETPGFSRPDWEIICDFAKAMGYPMNYRHPSEIMEEIAAVSPGYRGISYERIGDSGQVWPCPDSSHPGTPLLHTEKFPIGKGRFVPVNFIMPEEDADSEYPFVLMTGRRLEHYNNGSMTRRCWNFDKLMANEELSIHPDDAKRLNITDGQMVDVISRRGKARVIAKVTLGVMPGNVFMTFHFEDPLVNILTSHGMDIKTMTPEYKVCAVKISPVR